MFFVLEVESNGFFGATLLCCVVGFLLDSAGRCTASGVGVYVLILVDELENLFLLLASLSLWFHI